MNDVFTVSALTGQIRHLLERDPALQDTWVQGEVSNMTQARSGHWYFSLKDANAQIRCVMWRSSAARQQIVPAEGDEIMAHGYISVYEPRGDMQFYADLVRPVGVGDLYAQFEQLKARLGDEGLFDPLWKKPLPPFPQAIGVVTSADAAAFQDVLNVLRRRYPLARVILSPTLVQGKDAPPLIASALARLDASGYPDVILLVRGGGSIEDLWAFNDERVARAIHAAQTPIISGVGHETDFTIADFAADHRAPTPSAAAELATPDIGELAAGLRLRDIDLRDAMGDLLAGRRDQVAGAARVLGYVSPAAAVRNARQRVDERATRLHELHTGQLTRWGERLAARSAALEAANPRAILRRGYAIVSGEDGTPITDASAAPPGTGVRIQFADGERPATIDEDKT